jgi:transposase
MDGVERGRRLKLGARVEHYRGKYEQSQSDLSAARGAAYHLQRQVARLEEKLADALALIEKTRQQLAAKTAEIAALTPPLPPAAPRRMPEFIKPNLAKDPQKARTPGRKAGHAPAHRPLPAKIDVHEDVTVPRDAMGRESCPACRTQLHDVKKHERIVEDVLPAQVLVTCYHTVSGYCPRCRKTVESRRDQQPPAPPGVDLPQGQLGLNALATAALLRMQHRLPYRMIQQVFLDLPGLSVSAGAVARQIQRMGDWLEGQYERLKVLVHNSPAVHMDETSWRVNGQNHWLWAMLSEKQTVYHIDKSRSGQVARNLLGEGFTGTLVSDFYSAYSGIDCPQQKCLVHLLRELKETAEAAPAFARGIFHRRCRRLVQEMLRLKKKKEKITPDRFEGRVRKLERRLEELAREPTGGWTEPETRRLAKRLRGHEKKLTHFLRHDAVDGTNNAAERAIRPAVVARKISGGSRSQKGAASGAILLSILRTARQQNRPLLETLKTLLLAAWSGTNPAVLSDLLEKSA